MHATTDVSFSEFLQKNSNTKSKKIKLLWKNTYVKMKITKMKGRKEEDSTTNKNFD
jgi:hypothetical protein